MLRNNGIAGPFGVAKAERKGAWSWTAPLVFMLVLAGCAGAQHQNQGQTTNSATSVAELAAALPPPPPEVDRPPVIPVSLPGAARPKLTGLDRESVIQALGRPQLARREATAEVLTFRGVDCSLFVFLYDQPGGVGVVQHVEARAHRSLAVVPEARCIDSVLGRRAASSASPV